MPAFRLLLWSLLLVTATACGQLTAPARERSAGARVEPEAPAASALAPVDAPAE